MSYKVLSDWTLNKLTKAEIIGMLRTAEHNYFAVEEKNKNQFEIVKKLAAENDKLKPENKELKKLLKGASKCIEKLMRERGENSCKFCTHYEEGCKATEKGCNAAWAFAEQVDKLLGEDNAAEI